MRKKIIFILPIIAFILTGCDISLDFFNTAWGNSTSRSSVSYSIPDPMPDWGEGYYKSSQVKYTLRDANENIGWHTLNSTSEQKILVVPVQLNNGPVWTSKMLSNIYTVFFGPASETSWHSVSSFFAQSSYGKLNITGEVTSVLNVTQYSVSELNRLGSASDKVASIFEKSSIVSSEKKREYDQDKDGFIDATIFVYSNDYSTDSNSAYWAWCYYTESSSNTTNPNVNNYMWASYSFMNDSYSEINGPTGLEAHTYIHETGHLLGLDDYYCYDEDCPWDCAGDRDMQSYNIGDHNIYSKMALGWISPYVVTDSCEITLRSSALCDDAILIKDTWNGSIYDEYILIEFYTPEGANAQDSLYRYDTRNKMYNYSGLRIYHVDARLVQFQTDFQGSIISANYIDDFVNNGYCFVGASNSIDYQYLTKKQNPNNYLRYLHLIDKGGRNTLQAGTTASPRNNSIKIDAASTLWVSGDTFTATNKYFANGNNTFNDGSTVGYSVTVGEINGGTAKVVINKI